MSYVPITFDETGEPGWELTVDGRIFLAAPTGEIVGMEDDDGDIVPVEPGYEVVDPEFPGVDHPAYAEAGGYEEFEERLAAAEADAYGQPEEDDEEYGEDSEGEPDEYDIAGAALVEQIARDARARGFDYTRDEIAAAAERAAERVAAGEPVDLAAIQAELSAEGAGPPDLDNRQDRQDWMVRRLADAERDDRDQALDEPDPPSDLEPDGDDGEQRRRWLGERLEGRDVAPLN